MRPKNEAIQGLAKYIVNRCIQFGFTVQRYDAYSTDSVYIKLDFGVGHTIRISDHPGRKHLQYRYNIGTHIKEEHERIYPDKSPRYLYPEHAGDHLILKILDTKHRMIESVGIIRYQMMISKNWRENHGKAGFWSNAVIVNEEGGKLE